MDNFIDARGLSCPQPVNLTKQVLVKVPQACVVLVDDRVVAQDVIRLAETMGYNVDIEEKGQEFYINIEKGSQASSDLSEYGTGVIVVTNQYLGTGEKALGQVLMKSYFYALSRLNRPPGTIIFMNSGVFLTTQGSGVLEHLLALEGSGVEVYSSGTCLDFYQLRDQLMVGKVASMLYIVEIMNSAHKVIII